jgi:predicted DCC family thiol-disulfide oxidoreductase YuxK
MARYVAWQEVDVVSLGLTTDACREAVQWVSGNQRYAGHRAVAWLLRSAQQPWSTIGRVIDLPFLRPIGRGIYALVKANRSRLVHLCRQPIE